MRYNRNLRAAQRLTTCWIDAVVIEKAPSVKVVGEEALLAFPGSDSGCLAGGTLGVFATSSARFQLAISTTSALTHVCPSKRMTYGHQTCLGLRISTLKLVRYLVAGITSGSCRIVPRVPDQAFLTTPPGINNLVLFLIYLMFERDEIN